jgi:hypothetical protein
MPVDFGTAFAFQPQVTFAFKDLFRNNVARPGSYGTIGSASSQLIYIFPAISNLINVII